MLKWTIAVALAFVSASVCLAAEFPWQEPQANVTERGAIEWSPREFVDDLSGQDVRYIDYEKGDDGDVGLTKDTAWKHHPWDYEATGNAAECSGVKTYVFKRGVFYRGQLHGTESGTAEQPIRLTSTADWGEGEAILAGSVRLPDQWVAATEVDTPERLAEPERVWALKLGEQPWWNDGHPGHALNPNSDWSSTRPAIEPPFIGVFGVQDDGSTTWNHLARDPNWQPAGNEFAHDYWHSWDGDAKPFKDEEGNVVFRQGGRDEDLKGYPEDYFAGGIVWSTYPSLMGTAVPKAPIPKQIMNPKEGPAEWLTATVPTEVAIGQEFPVKLKVNQGPEDHKIQADLHWMKQGGFGGFNAFGGLARDVGDGGPYEWKFKPVQKEGLHTLVLTVYMSPTGNWGDRKRTIRIPIDVAEEADELQMKSVDLPAGGVSPYDPERGALALTNFRGFSKGTRYKIENLPQHLDTANEFYLDTDQDVLFYRPPQGKSPNEMQLELVVDEGLIHLEDAQYVEVSGLGFRYSDGMAVHLQGDCRNVTFSHCAFSDLMRHVFYNWVKAAEKNWDQWRDPDDWKLEHMTDITISDCTFDRIWDTSIVMSDGLSWRHNMIGRGVNTFPWSTLGRVEILRNKFEDVGIRHQGRRFSAIPTINVQRAQTGMIAGNVVKRSFGSGIMVFGGQTNGITGSDWPLTRVLVFNNSTEDTALAVNDYGGFSLWQGGQLYAFNNNIGNSTGYMPGGLFGSGRPTTLSYPYYIDGGYKIYGFNNIIWDRSVEPGDPYASKTAGYFSVFGFLNHFANNTVYRHARGTGGSSGNRTDLVSNVFAEITRQFLKNNRVENPSLAGGGDTGLSGIQGVPSLAYGRNVFHGPANAGTLVTRDERRGVMVPHDIAAETIEEMAEQMQSFPIRWGQLGWKVDQSPVVGELEPGGLTDKGAAGADFRLTDDSPAIDRGATYFIPWALAATVGEWNFTENHADPTRVVDYALYMSEIHFQRFMYNQVPTLTLQLNDAELDDYVPSPSEDWVNGAMEFDGERYAVVKDADMRADVELDITGFITGRGQRTWSTWKRSVNREVWDIPEPEGGFRPNGTPKFGDEQVATYPAERRNTLISTTRNLLLEARFRTEPGHTGGVIMAKGGGDTGYGLAVDPTGHAFFMVAADGEGGEMKSSRPVNDGEWHHVVGEIDRATGLMRIYVDGRLDAEVETNLSPETSIDTNADFTVGKSSAVDDGYFKGAIDFMRVCHATLEDSRTSIEELYAWQYVNGPHLTDMRGVAPKGRRRDAGALERR